MVEELDMHRRTKRDEKKHEINNNKHVKRRTVESETYDESEMKRREIFSGPNICINISSGSEMHLERNKFLKHPDVNQQLFENI